jgi:LmbE family N-acetylglucosaminyl deacetylase
MNKFTNSQIYKHITENKVHVFLVSPHLDDAVFSAGGLMMEFKSQEVPMTLINVFTKPSEPPYSISAKRYLTRCGYKDADKLFEERIKEDKEAVDLAGAKIINLGYVDALWRRRGTTGLFNILSKFIPEFDYIYPLFRFSMAYGKISLADLKTAKEIETTLKALISGENNSVIFIPLAIGHHVDHLIVRNICSRFETKKVYWADYPYIKTYPTENNFIKQNKLSEFEYEFSRAIKDKLVNLYKSQIVAIFKKTSESVTLNEKYYSQND